MDTPCIDHGMPCDKHGYARVWHAGALRLKHRVVLAEHLGTSIDSLDGQQCRHLCHNTRCINPEHLRLGTHADNMQDMVDAGRASHGEDHFNAKLTEEIVRMLRSRYVPRCRVNGARAMARELGMAHHAVCLAIKGEGWRHVG